MPPLELFSSSGGGGNQTNATCCACVTDPATGPGSSIHGSGDSTATIVGKVALLTMMPTIMMTIGSVVVQFYRPGGKLRSGMQHFAAGVVLAAVSMELLPAIVNRDVDTVGKHVALFAGFFSGVLLLIGLGRCIAKSEGEDEEPAKSAVPSCSPPPLAADSEAGPARTQAELTISVPPGLSPGGVRFTSPANLTVLATAGAESNGSAHESAVPVRSPAPPLQRSSTDPSQSKSAATQHHSARGSKTDAAHPPLTTPHRIILTEALRVDEEPRSPPLPPPPADGELTAGYVPLGVVLRRVPLGLVAAVATDGAQDGMLIGISYVAGAQAGIIMTIALTIEMCFLGISTSVVLAGHRVPRPHVLAIMCVLPLFIMMGGVLGASILAQLHGAAYYFVLAFGTAALLYLVADELLVEAHKEPDNDTIAVTIQFFIGFILVLLMQHVDE